VIILAQRPAAANQLVISSTGSNGFFKGCRL